MSNLVQWRAWVGPRWKDADDSRFWDWASTLTYGSAYEPLTDMPPTTLSTSITNASTTLVCVDTSGWPSTGGCWVGPNGNGQSWEYIAYGSNSTNTLGSLSRYTQDSEFSGTHTSGAAVRFWWQITGATALDINEYLDRNLSVVDWTAELSGVNMPQAALANRHLVLVQIRQLSGSTWGNWTNELVGWIEAPEVQDNYRQKRDWKVRLKSAFGYVGAVQVDGVQAGQTELTRRVSASASSSLAQPYKAADTGEFTRAAPDLDAQSALDSSLDTLWMSERYIGQTNTIANPGETFDGVSASSKVIISQVHVTKYTGQGDGYRWIELSVLDDTGLTNVYVMYSVLTGTAPNTYSTDYYFIIDMSSYSTGDRVVIAENATLFEAENPDHDAAAVIDGASLNYILGRANTYTLTVTGATSGTFTLINNGSYIGGSPTSSSIAYNAAPSAVETAINAITPIDTRVHCYGSNLPAGPVYIVIDAPQQSNLSGNIRPYANTIDLGVNTNSTDATPVVTEVVAGNDVWFSGTAAGTVATWFGLINLTQGIFTTRLDYNTPQSSLHYGNQSFFPGLDDNGLWTGTRVDTSGIPSPNTLRYIFDPSGTPSAPVDYWVSSTTHTPGYEPNGNEWLMFRRPLMGLRLLENITDSYTGVVSIGDLSGAAVPDGIANSGSTTIQIGTEQITVTRSGDTITITARGANSTTAAAHVNGDTVYVVESSVAVDAFPMTDITIKRLNATVPAIYNAKIYGSRFRQVRTPDQDATLADWTQIGADISANTAQDVSRTISATRYQWILIVITAMETQPYRACINGVEITNDSGVYNTARVLSSADAADVIERVLENSGIPSAAITDNGSTSSVDNLTTASDYAAAVATDLAELTRTRITVDRCSAIDLDPDPIFDGTTSYPSANGTLTDADLLDWNFDWDLNRTVSQVELLWKDTSGVDQDSVFFPSSPVSDGRRLRVGPYIYANSSAAAAGAEKLFYTRRVPFDIGTEIADSGRSYRPGQIYMFEWQIDDSMSTMSRKGLVISADHRLENGAWKTVLHALQLGRTDVR